MPDSTATPLIQLSEYRLIFWDFDGVIKESVDVKSQTFRMLFQPFGDDVAERVVQYHLSHGGMSRRKKIEYALNRVLEQLPSEERVAELAAEFAGLVRDKVAASEWVPGAEVILRSQSHPPFVLVTGTPQDEIEWIVERLSLGSAFVAIFGSPTEKSDAIRAGLAAAQIEAKDAVFIGDAATDYDAARQCGVNFILRESQCSVELLKGYDGLSVRDLRAVRI